MTQETETITAADVATVSAADLLEPKPEPKLPFVLERCTVEVKGKKDPQPAVRVTLGEQSEVFALDDFANVVTRACARKRSVELVADLLHFLSRPN